MGPNVVLGCGKRSVVHPDPRSFPIPASVETFRRGITGVEGFQRFDRQPLLPNSSANSGRVLPGRIEFGRFR
jgi:hypothetical protein